MATVVFILRGQPYHIVHERIVKAIANWGQEVLVLVGVRPDGKRTLKDPFNFNERFKMVVNSLEDFELSKVNVIPIMDIPESNKEWQYQVIQRVKAVDPYQNDVILVGHEKDDSSFYTKLFPRWKWHGYPEYEKGLSATHIRQLYFQPVAGWNDYFVKPAPDFEAISKLVPASTLKVMKEFAQTQDWDDLVLHYKAIKGE